jgi:hypothetical protein
MSSLRMQPKFAQQLRQLGDVGGDAPTRIKEAANTAASTH